MFLPLLGFVQKPVTFPLTIESIMRGYALVGHAPRNLRWSEDGTRLTFQWAKADGTQNPPYRSYIVDQNGNNLAEGTLPFPDRNEWDSGSRLGDEIAYVVAGDIMLYNTRTKSKENLTNSSDIESSPVYARNGLSIVFQRNGGYFRYSLVDRSITQLTSAKKPEGSASATPFVIQAPATFNLIGTSVSPSGTHVQASFMQYAKTSKNAQIARYITASSYVELSPTYARVGSPQNRGQIAFYNLETGKQIPVTMPKSGIFTTIRWSPDGKFGVLWGISEDHKDAWLYRFSTETETVETVYNEHDKGWIGGAWSSQIGWLPDSSKFYFLSENGGYNALMTMDAQGSVPHLLTPGKYEISDFSVDPDRSRFIYISSEGSPYDRQVNAMSFDGKWHQKLADVSADDDASFAISPDGTRVATVRSFTNRPPELFLNGKQITETPTKEWLSGPWIDTPIIEFTSRDGLKVPAKLFKPANWRRGGPGVVFVHGAGYLQNVFHGWSYYYREYMFHHYLMSKGYAVLDVDYRASSGYGKDWRTAIYRHMGGKDLDDVVDGANYLIKELGVGKDRLGVYGGSYGGFITFMAMFTAPEVFKSGAALRPVGDWANYHHGYTSPILNTPEEDPEAYKVSSPINFVNGLKGNLLICHGMVDANVQFQDSIRIVQKLIELGKKNWSVAPYPIEDHGFVQPESWTDEYRRIFDLFETTIGNHRKK